MSNYSIYHNPRCSKSRQTLAILVENNIEPEKILYLEQVPTAEQLFSILDKLGITARELLRKGEAAYKDLDLKNTSLSDTELVQYMCEYPKLIERPIVIKGNKAILGRPPENVLALINNAT